jgi:hypothetical protein
MLEIAQCQPLIQPRLLSDMSFSTRSRKLDLFGSTANYNFALVAVHRFAVNEHAVAVM